MCGTGSHGCSLRNDSHSKPESWRDPFQNGFTAVESHRWQVLAIRELRQVFAGTAYTYKLLEFVVVGRQVVITNRPVFSKAIAIGRFEIVVAQPPGIPPPMQNLSTHNTRPNPNVRPSRRC